MFYQLPLKIVTQPFHLYGKNDNPINVHGVLMTKNNSGGTGKLSSKIFYTVFIALRSKENSQDRLTSFFFLNHMEISLSDLYVSKNQSVQKSVYSWPDLSCNFYPHLSFPCLFDSPNFLSLPPQNHKIGFLDPHGTRSVFPLLSFLCL